MLFASVSYPGIAHPSAALLNLAARYAAVVYRYLAAARESERNRFPAGTIPLVYCEMLTRVRLKADHAVSQIKFYSVHDTDGRGPSLHALRGTSRTPHCGPSSGILPRAAAAGRRS